MNMILVFQPKDRSAIFDMDKRVLESVRFAIVRCYQDQGCLNTTVDIGSTAGTRALCHPFDLAHITRFGVKSLVAEGFNAYWDRTKSDGLPYIVHVDWRVALNRAQRAKREARRLRQLRIKRREERSTASANQRSHDFECKSTEDATSAWTANAEIIGLEMLANPNKRRSSLTNITSGPLPEN